MRSAMIIWLAALGVASAQFVDPFQVTAEWVPDSAGEGRLTLSWRVPAGHYLYGNALGVHVQGAQVTPERLAPRAPIHDAISGGQREALTHDFTDSYRVKAKSDANRILTVDYQGCSSNLCYRPQSRQFQLSATSGVWELVGAAPVTRAKEAGPLPPDFRVQGRTFGYVGSAEFIKFLNQSLAGGNAGGGVDTGSRQGIWVTLVLILLGGLALNLTPCVLPMIPVNLAIIGAGVQAGNRRRGFALGGFYGLGIAGAYGILGVVVLLTGARFGTLNAMPGFNLGIAVIFIGLAAAMFGLFNLDFSRFQKTGPASAGGGGGGYGQALVMGAVSALLAGACVAPAVIAVLVLAASLYAQGWAAALLLPFLLGIGMALPWPFAGAGLAWLPKPGAWMENIKRSFAAVILIAGLYYAWQGIDQIRSRSESARAAVRKATEQALEEGWLTSLPEAFAQARAEGKPVLIDFWATWRKNCLAMVKTTFKDPAVRQVLEGFIKVKLQAEQLSEPATRNLLDAYAVWGLPTYVVLKGAPDV